MLVIGLPLLDSNDVSFKARKCEKGRVVAVPFTKILNCFLEKDPSVCVPRVVWDAERETALSMQQIAEPAIQLTDSILIEGPIVRFEARAAECC